MTVWTSLVVLMFLSLSQAFAPDDKKYFIDGDLILGGLFPIHSTFKGSKCTDIQGQDGIQAVEAMRYSLSKVNRESSVLRGIKLGMLGVDTCESEIVALDNTLELVDMRFNKKANSETCSCKSVEIIKSKLIGVIGPASSKLSIPVASLLRLFKIPQISYQSTSPELSDKTRFEYFKRTVPSDDYQALVIADILRHRQYQYISIVYEDSSYGIFCKSQLENLSKNGKFCIGTTIKMSYFTTDTENQDIIKSLLRHRDTNGHVVVVAIMRPHSAANLFRSVTYTSHTRTFRWIATDGWAGRTFPEKDIQDVVEGSIGIQLVIGEIPGFKDYFTSLSYDNPKNPWWPEFVDSYERGCTKTTCNFEEFGILHYISDAVRSFAHAISTLQEEKCGTIQGLCTNLQKSLRSGVELLEALGNVSFPDSQGGVFSFVNSSEGPPRYSILRYTSDKKGKWETIGNYSGMGDKVGIYFFNEEKDLPHTEPSVCSAPCQRGYARIVTDNVCCWRCTKCMGNQYTSHKGCQQCPTGFRPNEEKNNCTIITVTYMSHDEPAAIGTLLFSSVGIAVCILVMLIFISNRNTPLVKATDLKLSLVLIISLIFSYGSSGAFLAKPSIISCGLTRCLLGLCYTLQYATLLTKTVRIYRLFQAKSPEKKKFIDSRSSITVTLLLTFFHVLGLIAWVLFDTPTTHVKYNEDIGILMCSDADNSSYAVSLSYSVALLVACVIFAIKTRKIPDGFKETRFISICSYTTCIIWLAFVSTFFFTNNYTVRVLSLCITLSINSTVSLCVLFLSRAYIIIFKPHLNTRERVMTRGHDKSDRLSKCLTSNKSVGTEDSFDDYLYNENEGHLPSTPSNSVSYQSSSNSNEPFKPESDDDEKILTNMREGKDSHLKNEHFPLRTLSMSKAGAEFSI